MKILIIISSTHRGNTRKIAEAMAKSVSARVVDIDNIAGYNLKDYDIVGFGSGIYFGKPDSKITDFIEKNSDDLKYTFVFTTSGAGNSAKNTKALIDSLKNKDKTVLGSFGCRAFCTYGPFKLIGGISKGHPDETDLSNAESFIQSVIQEYKKSV